MLLFFEGPKGFGKSTLIKEVAKLTTIKVWERDLVVEEFKALHKCWDVFTLGEMDILRCIDWRHNHMIRDRSPIISEWVWSALENRNSKYFKRDDWYLFPYGTAFVYLTREYIKIPGESDIVTTRRHQEQEIYEQIMSKVEDRFSTLRLATDKLSVDECALKIKEFMRKIL